METTTQHIQRGRVLIGLMLTMGLAAMDTSIVATAIPAIVRDLGGFTLFAWVFSIYTLVQAVTIPICSKLSDLYGRKPVLLAGIVIFILGSVLSGASWSMVTLILFRGVQGIGAGVIQPVISTVAGDLYSIEERARIQGWISSVWGISAVIGPAIGGFFTVYASWRWIFYINVPIGIFAFGMIALYLHENIERRQHRIDYLGSVLLAFGVGLLILGLLSGGVQWDWLSWPSFLVFTLGVLLMAAFVWHQGRTAEPIMPLWVFSNRVLIGSNLATLALGLISIGLVTFLPTYAQGVLGVSAIVAGFALAVMSISWPLSSSFSGWLYMGIGFRNTALVGAIICLGASSIFVLLPEVTSIYVVATGSFIMGAGLGLLSTPLLVGLQSVVDWNRRGVITGSNLFARQLGQTVGAAIFGGIANASLLAWLAKAPSSIAGQLPRTIDTASQYLGNGAHTLPAEAEAYLREGLFQASHQVFLALAIISLASIIALVLTPVHFKPLAFAEDKQVSHQHSEEQDAIIASDG